jgi:hypothetical protein
MRHRLGRANCAIDAIGEPASVALRISPCAVGDADRAPRRMTGRRTQHPPPYTRHRGPGCQEGLLELLSASS